MFTEREQVLDTEVKVIIVGRLEDCCYVSVRTNYPDFISCGTQKIRDLFAFFEILESVYIDRRIDTFTD